MKKLAVLFLIVGSIAATAQDTSAPSTAAPTQTVTDNTLTSLAGEFFHGDFVNYYAFASGVYDSTLQTLQTGAGSSGGFSIGGGVTASKQFSDGILSLNYRGDYRNYSGGYEAGGTDQYLNLIYSKRLGRRWTISFQEGAGILFYNSPYFGNSAGGGIQTNPFSPTTRFLSSSVYLSYRQTARLTYTLGGSFFLNRYNFPGAIGSTGGIFSASASYALTGRTNFGGTYSHDNFVFQHGAGNTTLDGGYANLSHTFGRGWLVNVSAGVTRAHTYGVINYPLSFILAGQTVSGYAVGHYDQTSEIPTVQGSVYHHFRSFNMSASAGRGVNPGNGTYLTSTNTYFGGVVSKGFRNSVLSANANYSRVTSIANAVAQAYSQNGIVASYSRIIFPHLSAYVTYNYNRYGALLNYSSITDNRFIFGVAFSSKNIPLTIY
ncbi:MAG: hypothetical protein M3Y24_12505 [Acidobacteriota bacterium]|nr:hypothetical protein [Acidobacteriota bacterium]